MRAGGGKAKGASFEREICRLLSLWVSHGKQEDLYWRSAMSGGRATVGKRRGVDLVAQAGDISSVHKAGHVLTTEFYFETKHVKELHLDNFMVKGTGQLATFWETAAQEAASYHKAPVIIARQNRFPTLWISEDGIVDVLHGATIKRRWPKGKLAMIRVAGTALAIWNFDLLLATPFKYSGLN